MFFFILQSLFWFLLAFFAGIFLGRWLKRLLCRGNQQSVPVLTSDTTKITDDDTKIHYRKHSTTKTAITNDDQSVASMDNSYDAMINKLKKERDTEPKLNVANLSMGAAAATLGTAAYSALKANDNTKISNIADLNSPSSLVFDSAQANASVKFKGSEEVDVDDADKTSFMFTETTATKADIKPLINKVKPTDPDQTLFIPKNEQTTEGVGDDLKLVMGIGPKIMELLNNAEIYTFNKLANTPVETLQTILDQAGDNFRVADPATWAEQATLADKKEWDKLNNYKGHLN